MGSFKAFALFSGLVIYFFIFLFIASVFNEANVDEYLDLADKNNGFCENPRIAFDFEARSYFVTDTSKRCVQTRVSFDPTGCEQLEGCVWQNESSFLFWSTEARCTGTIDLQFYSNETLSPLAFYNVCQLSGFQNETNCYNVGCRWNQNVEDIDVRHNKGLIATVGELFTFTYDFGFEDDDADNLTIFFTFYLPFILLLGAGYFMLPFIH